MSNKSPMYPRSKAPKKPSAKEQEDLAKTQIRGFLTTKKEQYAMNILNGMLANPNVNLYDIEKDVKELIDKAFELAQYQMEKMYDLQEKL